MTEDKRELTEARIDFESVKRAFMNDWGIEVEQERYETFSRRGISVSSEDGPAENGEREWLVFESEDDAEEEAILRVTQDLEEEPEIFNKSFIEQHLYVSDTDRRIIANEEADSRIEDYEDEDIMHEVGELRDYEDAVETAEEDNNWVPVETMVEEAKEELFDQIYKEWYDGLADPIQFLVKDQGIYSMSDLMKASFIQIKVEEAARDAVSTDGVAHFLDIYDGEEEEITDPKKRKTYYVYGTN